MADEHQIEYLKDGSRADLIETLLRIIDKLSDKELKSRYRLGQAGMIARGALARFYKAELDLDSLKNSDFEFIRGTIEDMLANEEIDG